MEFVRPFSKLGKKDTHLAGGKGASLGEITRAGIPVPPGFVVLAGSFDYFIDQAGLRAEIESILAKVNHQEIHTVEAASQEIQAMILSAKMPKSIEVVILKSFAGLKTPYVAVRSSATAEDSSAAAWAGQLDSYLNTTKAALLPNVKKCWASLFTPRAIFYRFEKKLHTQAISVAVVVQKMVESEVSGIGFSVHPVTQDRNQMIIEAGFGLGEAIVSGQITPDSYVVTKQPRKIEDIHIAVQERGLFRAKNSGNAWQNISKEDGAKQALTDEQILELADIILEIEQHYGFPVDTEWAWEKGKFYIVQSRPITTLTQSDPSIGEPLASKSDSYVRLFRITSSGLPFLLSDIFAEHYKTLGCYLTAGKGEWISYLPESSVNLALKEGLDLFSDAKSFSRYVDDFSKYMRSSKIFFKQAIKKRTLSKADVAKFFKLASKVFYYYSKTEFFYTDQAFLESQRGRSQVLRRNLKRLEHIKQTGRQHLNTIMFEPAYVRTLMRVIGRQFKIPLSAIESYSITDVLSLFDQTKLSQKKVLDRKKAFVMIGHGQELEYLAGETALRAIQSFSTTDRQMPDELQGVTAHAGRARGRIRVISSDYYFDFSKLKKMMAKMKQGEILVAETTSPEMMPACKKAAAIITDQGGLLSHAAIVSRELDVPCIVQVQNATQLLKNGDLVEVDAGRGIVRKLS